MTKLGFLIILSSLFIFTSCSDDDDNGTENTLSLDINGLEDLGDQAQYEGWLIVNGSAITTGVFTVDANGHMSQNKFEIDPSDLDDASTFVLTVEPIPDNDPAPSDVHILAGDFSGDDASLSISHGAALNSDFEDAQGAYILATPTDGMMNNENSGVWFLDLTSGSPAPGLALPTLPTGWIYEGWAVIDGQPVSTGTFSSGTGADSAGPFSGPMNGPPFPGEDFLTNAPSGLSFPTDLSGGTIVVSIEPVPDNSAAPFALKPLVSQVANDAADHETFMMMQNLSFPTGNATR